jgi:GDPmannose 4,6-dehydratase
VKVLVTGASGFVAPHLMEHLVEKGHEAYGLVQLRADCRVPQRLLEDGKGDLIHITYGDVREFSRMLSLMDNLKPDWVFHLASQSFVPDSFKNPIYTFNVNSGGTQNILEAIRLRSPKTRLIFAGSSEEYGLQFLSEEHYAKMKEKYGEIEPGPVLKFKTGSELPINEQNPLRPMSPYAVSKVQGDYLCRNYWMTYNVDTVVSRAFNHEGAGRGAHFVTSSIVRQLVEMKMSNRQTLAIGDKTVTRDWSHVDDICEGYILLAEKAESGSVYVQGSGEEHSVDEFIRLAAERLNLDKEFWQLHDVVIDPTLYRKSDVPHLRADTTKIKRLGYVKKKGLEDIIDDQINYYLDETKRRSIII